MSRRAFTFPAILFAVACLASVPATRAGEVSHARIVRLSYTLGDVQMSAEGASGWHKAIANTPLREGNSVETGDGRAEVEFELGAMAWMASNTVIEFPQLALDDGAKNTQLTVKQGTATFYVKPGKHDSFVVQAGGVMIAAPESSRFRVDVFEDGAAVSVLRGEVDVTARGASQRVNSPQTLALRDDLPGNGAVSASPRNDAWDRWVSDRYTSVDTARVRSTDYLNAPVGYGMADLGMYGGWVNVPGYGMGWQPYGVGLGWSPFYDGYWDGMGAFGPTWISYEPWGWLPYHYGGWMYSPIYGWVWGPAGGFGAWSPGTVFWRTTPTGIGWVPRGPNETLNGTPVNLAHGVVTNTTAGMQAGSGNTLLRGAAIAKAQMTGEWTGEAAVGRIGQPAQAPSLAGAAKGARSAQHMPQGGAPRIASAGMLAGRVQVYRPSMPMSRSGGGFGSKAPAYSKGTAPAPAGSASSHGDAAPSHAATSGSHAKP